MSATVQFRFEMGHPAIWDLFTQTMVGAVPDYILERFEGGQINVNR
jgi:hypothetical protein